ncbi:hypothetical protein RSO41_07155 [Halomonas sp. I1]|uniref:hypothetical protein n=1 Tax=Halomonas sp. I1 TaxID=393536 RepID=UPI0028DF4E63|nr:hypothetical protein [Halomonas sp. I1]MDT8894432.1 hypothetical protein [Halomonas sp. I1]
MIGILIVPLLICGITYIYNSHKQFAKISTYQGWLVYLHAARFGFYIFMFSIILFEVAPYFINKLFNISYYPIREIRDLIINEIDPPGTDKHKYQAYVYSAIFSVLTISGTYVSLKIKNFIFKNGYDKSVEKVLKSHSVSDYLLLRLLKKREEQLSHGAPAEELMYAFITLSNRKIYIGSLKLVPPPNEERTNSEEFLLVPFFSGYRDEKSLSVNITHMYEYESPESIREEDAISFSKSNIITIGAFSTQM